VIGGAINISPAVEKTTGTLQIGVIPTEGKERQLLLDKRSDATWLRKKG